jgi:ABC-type sugar transport system ATPase subunit
MMIPIDMPSVANMRPLLEMRGIRKSFSGTEVLRGVDLTVDRGQVVALLGENGAGKSTLIKILNGDYARDAGEIHLDGKRVELRTPRDAHRAGIQVIYQELNDVPDVSVAENVLLGRLPRRPGVLRPLVDWPQTYQLADQVLSQLDARVSPRRPMRTLRVGQRQLVEIAKALSSRARVLVLDEPTAALTPPEVERLFATIASLRQQGVGIIYISHRLDEVERIAQRIVVLRDGAVAGTANAAEVGRRDIVRMMVGHEVADSAASSANRNPPSRHDNPPLEVVDLSRTGEFREVSFALHAGETLGLFGLLGAGHMEVARAIFGAAPATSGQVRLGGRTVSVRSPRQARRQGIGFVPEDRKLDGLVLGMNVADNLAMAHWEGVSTAGVLRPRVQLRRAAEWVSRLGIRLKRGVRQPVGTLSGGNQQKVVLARWLEAGVRILLLNEPTRGVDVGARADIYNVLGELRAGGLALMVCSSDLEELLEVCDRVLVFARGQNVAEFDRKSATRASLLAAAAGGSA